MATTVTINSSYAGLASAEYFQDIFLSLQSLSNGMFKVVPNIEGKQVVRTILLSGVNVADGTCDFAPTGTVAYNERVIEPELFQIQKTICKKDFLSSWSAGEMLPGANLGMPSSPVDALITATLGESMQQIERNLYSGDTANAGEFTGVETLLALDAALPAAQEVTGTTVTALNVVDEIGKVIDATPDALRDQAGFHIGVASNVFYKLVRSQGGFMTKEFGTDGVTQIGGAGVDNKGVSWYAGGDVIMFEDIPVIKCSGMTSNVMLATYTDNFWFGTSLESDLQTIKTLDMENLDLSLNINFSGRYLAAVQYGSAEHVVTYGIVNSAN